MANQLKPGLIFKFILLICCFSLQIAEAALPLPYSSKTINRLSFFRTGLFYETATQKTTNPDGTYSFGPAAGIDISVNPPYEQIEPKDKASLGWSVNCVMGYNFQEKKIRPYVFNIGFWGGYMLNDQIEVGAQYCFLGVYGYQNWQIFGSHISPAIRIQNLQLVYGRSGDGMVYGCIKPRFGAKVQQYFEASYFIYKGLTLGARMTSYTRAMSGPNDMREYRFFLAMNMGQSFKR
jgi:hypothetical protein